MAHVGAATRPASPDSLSKPNGVARASPVGSCRRYGLMLAALVFSIGGLAVSVQLSDPELHYVSKFTAWVSNKLTFAMAGRDEEDADALEVPGVQPIDGTGHPLAAGSEHTSEVEIEVPLGPGDGQEQDLPPPPVGADQHERNNAPIAGKKDVAGIENTAKQLSGAPGAQLPVPDHAAAAASAAAPQHAVAPVHAVSGQSGSAAIVVATNAGPPAVNPSGASAPGRAGVTAERMAELRRLVFDRPTHPQIVTDLKPFHAGVAWDALRRVYNDDRRHARRLYLACIIQGVLYMDGNAWGSDTQWVPKGRDWIAQLQSVLTLARQANISIPDVTFAMQLGSMPYLYTRKRDRAAMPIFSMAKSDDFSDVLYPNPYFGTVAKWDSISDKLLSAAKQHTWETRTASGFWRGSCVNWPGSKARVDLVSLNPSPNIDVALITRCPTERWPAIASPRGADKAMKARIGKLRVSGRVNSDAFSKFKYLFHMPGATQGSYSRNMQIVLGVGGVVLFWEAPFYEFFYSSLKDGEHLMNVNASTAVRVVQYLREHDAMARRIAGAAAEWYAHNLRGVHIAQYWLQLLIAYSKVMSFRANLGHLKDPCTCSSRVLERRSRATVEVPNPDYDPAAVAAAGANSTASSLASKPTLHITVDRCKVC